MMGSSLRRLKIYYINHYKTTRSIVTVVLLLAVVAFIVAPKLFGKRSSAFYKSGNYDHEGEPNALRSMVDTRPMRCRDHAYEFTRLDGDEKISIITEFHGASFYDLRTSLTSIVEHTPYDLYTEIIVLDDGTKDPEVKSDCAKLVTNPMFNKVKVYSSDTHDGPSASRFKAAAVSTGEILIFVDSSTVVNHGWIQPLLAKVLDDPNLIAVPHYDRLGDGDQFTRVDEEFINVFTWSLSTVNAVSRLNPGTDLIKTPVMRGDVFAVRRAFLEQIGSFDENLRQQVGLGYHVELSLRAWMCGGSIRISTCSRVAVRDAQRPQRLTDARDVRRITELWLGEFQPLVYRQTGVEKSMSQQESDLLVSRRAYIRRQQQQQPDYQCKPFGWYVGNVLMMSVVVPSVDAQHVGKLRAAKSGLCICSHVEDASVVVLARCNEHLYERDCMFEMTARGAIRRDKDCLESAAESGGQVVTLRPCELDSPKQRWWLNDGHLTPVTAPRRCLTDALKRDANVQSRVYHVLAIEDCSETETGTAKQKWHFWNF